MEEIILKLSEDEAMILKNTLRMVTPLLVKSTANTAKKMPPEAMIAGLMSMAILTDIESRIPEIKPEETEPKGTHKKG